VAPAWPGGCDGDPHEEEAFMRRIVIVAAIVCSSAIALAGYKDNGAYPIVISSSGRYAWGRMSSVRLTTSTVEYIGCGAAVSPSGSASVMCWAKSAGGTYVSCSSSSAPMAQMVAAMSNDAEIQFNWDATGQCTWINVKASSDIPPKTP
jgi:hypothetical protein